MKVPQKYFVIGIVVILCLIAALHQLSKRQSKPIPYEEVEEARDWVDEKDPITGV